MVLRRRTDRPLRAYGRREGLAVDLAHGGEGEDVHLGVPRGDEVGREDLGQFPAQFLAVDLLWLEGVSSLDVPYAQRRDLLDGLALAGPHCQTPPWFPGVGADALRAAREQGLPGVVAKRLDSPYEPGRRSRHWLSIDAS